MKKSISKRIRITRTGKILRRAIGLSHARANKSSTQMRRKTSVKRSLTVNKKIFNS